MNKSPTAGPIQPSKCLILYQKMPNYFFDFTVTRKGERTCQFRYATNKKG